MPEVDNSKKFLKFIFLNFLKKVLCNLYDFFLTVISSVLTSNLNSLGAKIKFGL